MKYSALGMGIVLMMSSFALAADAPASKPAEGEEAAKLLNMEALIHERIVGQDEAVKAVAQALREYRSGLTRKGGPIASFLFVGPTGVGKTELAKILAEIQFGSQKMMVRFDMTEYQDKTSFYRFIGSPDGTVRVVSPGWQAPSGAAAVRRPWPGSRGHRLSPAAARRWSADRRQPEPTAGCTGPGWHRRAAGGDAGVAASSKSSRRTTTGFCRGAARTRAAGRIGSLTLPPL